MQELQHALDVGGKICSQVWGCGDEVWQSFFRCILFVTFQLMKGNWDNGVSVTCGEACELTKIAKFKTWHRKYTTNIKSNGAQCTRIDGKIQQQ